MTIKTKASTLIILDIILIGIFFLINIYLGLFLLIIYIVGMYLLRNRIKNIYFTVPETFTCVDCGEEYHINHCASDDEDVCSKCLSDRPFIF